MPLFKSLSFSQKRKKISSIKKPNLKIALSNKKEVSEYIKENYNKYLRDYKREVRREKNITIKLYKILYPSFPEIIIRNITGYKKRALFVVYDLYLKYKKDFNKKTSQLTKEDVKVIFKIEKSLRNKLN
jgi:hypothetical protein